MKRYTILVTGTDDYYVSALTDEQIKPFSPCRLITQKLAKYENTELEPQEVVALKQRVEVLEKALEIAIEYYSEAENIKPNKDKLTIEQLLHLRENYALIKRHFITEAQSALKSKDERGG